MKIFRTYFTSYVSPGRGFSQGVIYWGGGEYYHLLDGEVRVATSEEKSTPLPPLDKSSDPFARADFATYDRLGWPAGACTIPRAARLLHWNKRFVMWTDEDKATFFVVDATRAIVLELRIPGLELRSYGDILFHGNRFYFDNYGVITSIAASEIEALFDAPSGTLDVRIRETYPERKPDRFEDVVVARVSESEATVRAPKVATRKIPVVPGLAVGMHVKLCDLYKRDEFCAIELPGQPRQQLFHLPSETAVVAQLAHEPAIDPVGGLGISPPAETTRTAELDQLFGALADNPDDDATRSVLVDLLEEAGEPYAPELAALRADTDPKARGQALGLLAKFIFNIEWRNHLPFAGTLASSAPLENWVCESAGNDRRLGFFRTLRIGEGPFAVYAKLVGAPRAVGLRHVDVPRVQIIQALIAGKRTQLTSLGNVRFTTRDVIESLADPTFDRVVDIETETGATVAAKFLEFILRDETKFWSRAPRHLILSERSGREDLLLPIVATLWKNLPLAKLTIGEHSFAR